MNLKDQLQSDLKDAMRAGDVLRKNTLRMALSAIKLAEIEKNNPLDENAVLAVIQKEVKSRRESIADAERAGRPDLIQATEQEISLLEHYLPKALDPVELETLARQAIQEAGATSLKEMGQVMKILMPQLQGRATGDQASQIVRRLLA
ncbi:MAG TPA: GatB/YqeY domain-containing protein [Anaerolineales bacterium]|nr:GatB/YqeY domain-containing protein [Anaerolineales bacterium]